MDKENFSTRERIDALKTYGSSSDEVCYALRRLQKIGAVPFEGKLNGSKKDILRDAVRQAKDKNQMVALYLGEGMANGMYLITPGQSGYADAIDAYWPVFLEHAEKDRFDKPIQEQKQEEEFDRFKIYEYGLKLYKKWDVSSKEGMYAAERLEKMGVEPYKGRFGSDVRDMFWEALRQAKKEQNKVGICFNSGAISGLFVVAPEAMADDREYALLRFEQYAKNQENFRYDKPIVQQKIEEQQKDAREGGRQ